MYFNYSQNMIIGSVEVIFVKIIVYDNVIKHNNIIIIKQIGI